jgi:tetratricopeptide (TPR) repeat protein/predicted Ser/Thr protein kinase
VDPFRTPTAIGRYQIVSRLGKGAMGVVFSARDERLGREVAIKVMNAGLDDEPDTRARFFREAQVTSKLLHRNIVTVFDLGEDSGRPFIVMELLKGKTLNQALKDPALQTLEVKLDLMIQLCEGLSKAHSAGVIHRDIKPSNLFVLPDGSLKILDFGIARLASSNMTRTGLVVGTPDYMSPEQARGGEVDERADVFSAAGVFYYMVTGRKPFAGPDVATSLRRVMKEDPDPMSPAEAPAPLAAVITRALNKDPALRYQRCVDMASDLIRFKRNFDTETRRIGALAKAQFDEAQKIAKAIQVLRQDSAVVPAEWVDEEVRLLDEHFSYFSSSGSGAPVAAPTRRAQLAEINAELLPVVQKLAGELTRLQDERAQRVRKLDELAAQAESCIPLREFDRAESLLGEAAAAGMPADRLQQLQAAVSDARLVATTIAGAHQASGRGAWDEAVSNLQSVVDARPDLSPLRVELDKLKVEHARLKELAARQRQAAELTRETERLLSFGDLSAAVKAADRVLAMVPQHAEAARLRAEAVARLEQQAQAAITAARARNHVTKALQHFAAGRFDKAVTEAETATELVPEAPRPQAVRKEARRLLDDKEAARRKILDAREREREVNRLIGTARSLLANGDAVPALRDAESAVALDPTHEEARHVLDHVHAYLELMSGDDDDTKSLAPVEADRSSGFARFVGHASEAVSDVGRRLSERLKNRKG